MCGCATLTIRRELPSTHVHPDRESIVRRDSPRHEEIFSAKRLHVLSLAQNEALEHGVRHLHFEVDSIDLGIPERAEVKVELREPGRTRHIELYFLAQLAPERIYRSLTGIDRAPETTPMRRIENPRLAVAQLHDVTAVFVDEQRGHGVVGTGRTSAGGNEVFWSKPVAFDEHGQPSTTIERSRSTTACSSG